MLSHFFCKPAILALNTTPSSLVCTEEIKTDFYAELPINIEVKGTFYDIGSFSADLAALSRIVVLSDIRINTLENTDMVLMKAKAKTYRYLDEEEIAEQARIAKEAAEKARKGGKGKGVLAKGKENAQKAGSKSDTAVKKIYSLKTVRE